jgi:hypothetical protein
MTPNEIKQYTDQLGLTCDQEACESILEVANEWGIADVKDAVWEFMDFYEGISHSRDLEYWSQRGEGVDDDE